MRRSQTLVLAAIASCFLAGCESEREVTAPINPPDPGATLNRVQAEVFTPSCALSNCHKGTSAKAALNLEPGKSFGNTVGVPSIQSSLFRINPGQPDASFLISKIRGDGEILGNRMPPGGPYLSTTETKLVVDWVRRGAPND